VIDRWVLQSGWATARKNGTTCSSRLNYRTEGACSVEIYLKGEEEWELGRVMH